MFIIALLIPAVNYYVLIELPLAYAAPLVVFIDLFGGIFILLCMNDKLMTSKIDMKSQLLISVKKFFPLIFLAILLGLILALCFCAGIFAGSIITKLSGIDIFLTIGAFTAYLVPTILGIYLSQTLNAFILGESTFLMAMGYSWKLVRHSWWHVFSVSMTFNSGIMSLSFLSVFTASIYGHGINLLIQSNLAGLHADALFHFIALCIVCVIVAVITLIISSTYLAIFYNLKARKLARTP